MFDFDCPTGEKLKILLTFDLSAPLVFYISYQLRINPTLLSGITNLRVYLASFQGSVIRDHANKV